MDRNLRSEMNEAKQIAAAAYDEWQTAQRTADALRAVYEDALRLQAELAEAAISEQREAA